MNKKGCLVFCGPAAVGGHTVVSFVRQTDTGVCRLVDPNTEETIAVVGDRNCAEQVAMYAVSPDGGYCAIEIHPAPDQSAQIFSVADYICS